MQRLNNEQLNQENLLLLLHSLVTHHLTTKSTNSKLSYHQIKTLLHCKNFRENFEEALKTENEMFEPHKKNSLLEVMQCPKAMEVTEIASKKNVSMHGFITQIYHTHLNTPFYFMKIQTSLIFQLIVICRQQLSLLFSQLVTCTISYV